MVDEGSAEGPAPLTQYGDKKDEGSICGSSNNDRPKPEPVKVELLALEATGFVEDGKGDGNGDKIGDVGTLGKLASFLAIFEFVVEALVL